MTLSFQAQIDKILDGGEMSREEASALAMVGVVAFFALNIRVPGNLIGPLALFVANALGALAILHAMCWERRTDLPVPETNLAQNLR